MTSYLKRAKSALQELLRGRRDTGGAPQDGAAVAAAPAVAPTGVNQSATPSPPIAVGPNILLVAGRIEFADPSKGLTEPDAWLDAMDASLAQNAPLSDGAITTIERRIAGQSADPVFANETARHRFLDLLRPRVGLSARLGELRRAGVINVILPESTSTLPHALLAIQCLERLGSDASLTGERFGSMLREISSPEILVVTLLLYNAGGSKDDVSDAVRTAQPALERLGLNPDAKRGVEFLIQHQLRMSLMALRQDTGDPGVVSTFAGEFSTEEQLKMLCLLTVADLDAMGPDSLTPWKAELLWRLFVDTYNHMTMAYGDEVIDSHEAALAALKANRPHDISDAEMASFLQGLPRRYLTLFEPESIYQHVRLWRDIKPDDVHFFLNKKGDVWELAVVTLDKPYLFSNICGVLSCLDLDILRGFALTSRSSLVVDVFRFTDHKGCLVRPQLDPLLSDVVAGRVDITAQVAQKVENARQSANGHTTHTAPVVYFDQESSQRYTILELVAEDAPGLLHRVSRIISAHGCAVDLVLISTQGTKAIDVFHMRKGAGKLSDADELALTEDFERLLDEPRPGSVTH